jgi:hypothetical protein
MTNRVVMIMTVTADDSDNDHKNDNRDDSAHFTVLKQVLFTK